MHVQLWPVMSVLGVVLLGVGLAYGAARGGGGGRRGDAAAEAGAKAEVSPGARGAAIAAAAVGILLLLGSGITAWQYEARSGGQAANKAGLDHMLHRDSQAELNASVTSQAPTYGEKGVTTSQAARQNLDARRQAQDAAQGPTAAG